MIQIENLYVNKEEAVAEQEREKYERSRTVEVYLSSLL